jgi:hypothetical protein
VKGRRLEIQGPREPTAARRRSERRDPDNEGILSKTDQHVKHGDTPPPRPVARKVIPDGIPADLRDKGGCVVWRYELRGEDWTKPPFNPRTGRHAKSTDPRTCGTFAEAMGAYQAGGYDGIGRVHGPQDNLTAFDLDGCVDPATGDVAPWALAVVREIDSYAEFSPGDGIRILAYGRKPDNERCKRGPVEMYDGATKGGKAGGRYLTLTGHKLPDAPADIRDRTEQIADVYRRLILGKAGTNGKHMNDDQPAGSNGKHSADDPVAAFREATGQTAYGAHPGAVRRRFEELVGKCGTVPVGERSDADWAACCYALEHHIRQEDAWQRMQGVGKVAAEGRRYFDHTWQEAEAHVRQKQAAQPGGGPEGESPTSGGGYRNYFEVTRPGRKPTKVGFPVQTLHESLKALTGGWPKGAHGMLFAEGRDLTPEWMKKPPETLAWVGGRLEPGPANGLKWVGGPDKVSQACFHAYLVQQAERFDAVEPFPHHPPMPGHYYMHSPLPPGGSGAFLELLRRFNPSTPVDSDLIAAAFMTPFAGIEPGQRPAFLITAEDDDEDGGRGTGKTTLAELAGRLCGGHIELRATDEWDRLVTRLLSPAALGRRVALLDNVKALRFSWAEMEAGITTAVISGRQLYVGEGRRPNTLTFFVTLNGASLSKDMAQRCVLIVLKRPQYDAAWEEGVIRLIETRRWEIIADIIDLLKAPAPPLARYSRWSAWEKAVLSRVAEPSDCQKVIEDRQAAIDDDQDGAEEVRAGIHAELLRRGHDPDAEKIWVPSQVAAALVNKIENELHRPYPRAMAHLYTLNIPEIRKSNRGDRGGGCTWTGRGADPAGYARDLRRDPDTWR